MFGYILARHPQFKKLPVHKIKPKYYASGNKYRYYLAKTLFRSPGKIRNKILGENQIPLEPWNDWIADFVIEPFLAKYRDTLIEEYISRDAIDKIITSELDSSRRGTYSHLCGKIITAELVLRYIAGR
jgi:hypothetical protein